MAVATVAPVACMEIRWGNGALERGCRGWGEVGALQRGSGRGAVGQRRQRTRGKEVRVAGLQVPGGIRGARMGARVRNE